MLAPPSLDERAPYLCSSPLGAPTPLLIKWDRIQCLFSIHWRVALQLDDAILRARSMTLHGQRESSSAQRSAEGRVPRARAPCALARRALSRAVRSRAPYFVHEVLSGSAPVCEPMILRARSTVGFGICVRASDTSCTKHHCLRTWPNGSTARLRGGTARSAASPSSCWCPSCTKHHSVVHEASFRRARSVIPSCTKHPDDSCRAIGRTTSRVASRDNRVLAAHGFAPGTSRSAVQVLR